MSNKNCDFCNFCDFSKNFEKLEKSQFLLLRANLDISGRDTLIFSRAVFLAFVFLKQEI